MARPLRVQFRNGWYHVTARGSNRQNIYRDERDRLHFLELLGEMSERHTVEVHSYALMDNHYHLLLRTPLANLSRAVQWLNTAYGIWWNLRHRRVGHVFQGRFKSVVVESGQWVLECSLYIHLNPVAISVLELSKAKKKAERRGLTVAPVAVRAKRLEVLRSCPWSSFRALAGYSRGPQWLCREELLGRAGGEGGYRRLAEERAGRGLEQSLWSWLKWGLVLGGEGFARKVRAQLEAGRESKGRRALRAGRSWAQVVRGLERARGERWAEFAGRHGDPGLAMALYVARRCTGLTLRQLGQEAGGMDYTAVSMAIKRFEQRLGRDRGLCRMTERLLTDKMDAEKCAK
jgi:REP element-mobilizing transposase RayT